MSAAPPLREAMNPSRHGGAPGQRWRSRILRARSRGRRGARALRKTPAGPGGLHRRQLAAERADAAGMAELEAYLGPLDRSSGKRSGGGNCWHSIEGFHTRVAALTGNGPELIRMMGNINARIQFFPLGRHERGVANKTQAEHRGVLEAIRQREADRARIDHGRPCPPAHGPDRRCGPRGQCPPAARRGHAQRRLSPKAMPDRAAHALIIPGRQARHP